MLDAENDATLPPVRISKTLLHAVKIEAARRDETLSQMIRRACRAYVESAPRQSDLESAIRATKNRSRKNG